MDGVMKSLSRKMLTQFVVCIAALLTLATPLFYFLTKHYYAEDMIDIIEAVKRGQPIPALDLEQDIMQGVTLQFGLIVGVLAVAIVLTLRFISRRLWQPFDLTLRRIEGFRLENGKLPTLPDTDVKEFARLNHSLETLMRNSLASYRTQKEFTENASHELQHPARRLPEQARPPASAARPYREAGGTDTGTLRGHQPPSPAEPQPAPARQDR